MIELVCEICLKVIKGTWNYKLHTDSCSNPILCKICLTPINKKQGNKVYCSIDCKYIDLKNNNKKRDRNCVVCKKDFKIKITSTCYNKTCSRKCLKELMSLNARNNINCGARAHYKNCKKLLYKDIVFDSNWEIEIAKWLDELNIQWIRDRKHFFWWFDEKNKNRRYTADFYLPKFDLYIDTKNSYLIEVDKFKIAQVIKLHKIKLIVGNIDYVKNEVTKYIN